MKTPGISSASCFRHACIFVLLVQMAASACAQDNAKPEPELEFFDTIQAGHEDDALAKLEADTNLVQTVVNGTKYPLLEAAAAGEVKLVKRLLELGADINVQGDTMMSGGSQSTALDWAAQRDQLEVCRVLLEAGADPNRMAFGFQTPLHRAFSENHEDIADLLLDYGAEPFQGKLFSNDETTPFELAITKSDGRLVPRMLGQDARHPLGTKSRQKPRHLKRPRPGMKTGAEVLAQHGVELATVAAQRGELEALTALFRAGVSIREAETNCPTILQAYSLAANDTARNLPEVVRQWQQIQNQLQADFIARSSASFVASLRSQESNLSNRVEMMASDRWHNLLGVLVDQGADYDAFAATALGDAAQVNQLISKNKRVVEARDCKGETPLHWAIHTEQPSMLTLWISAGVPLDATNTAGETALHLAAANGRADDVKVLLAAGASTSLRDTNGWTALDAAIQNKQSDCIHLLLPEHPSAEHPERARSMSLHEAAAAGNVASLVALLDTETNLEARNELGLTPLQVAVTKGHLAAAALLVDKGANVNACDPAGNGLLHQILLQDQLIIYDRPPTNWLDRVGQDPAKKLYVQYLAVGPYEQGPNPLLQAASFLLACGANASAKNQAGDTPMQLIVDQKTGRGVFFFDDDREKLLQLLSVHGSNVDERDADGNTALHRLCTGFYDVSKVETMASLIASGANVNATNISAAKRKAQRTVCTNNLRQINLGVLMYSDDSHDASPSPGGAGLTSTNIVSLYSGYKALMKHYVGLNGASSPQDKLFQCPADTFYPSWFDTNATWPFYFVQKSIHDEPLFDYSSYAFNGGDNTPRKFGRLTPTYPGLGGVKLSAVRHPSRTVLVAEISALAPYSWHDPSSHGVAHQDGTLYNDSKNVVSFVDGHVSYIKMYWNPGHGVAGWYDPPAGYDYQWSPD